MMQKNTQLALSRSRFLQSGDLTPYLNKFICELERDGYAALSIDDYYASVAHFGMWLQKKRITPSEINGKFVTAFANHHCQCPGGRSHKHLSRRYVRRVQRFVFYLQKEKLVPLYEKPPEPPELVIRFRDSLLQRGLATATINNYLYLITKLLSVLGEYPMQYHPAQLRDVVVNLTTQHSRTAVKKQVTALKAYLRFLITEGLCSPGLDVTIPVVPEWKLSSLPRYLVADDIDRVIDSCDRNTHQGLRDRAIILLLVRLGLRAGDIVNMRIGDIDWTEGTLCIGGKGRREDKLPLPQEVGDTLLAYLKIVRPPVSLDHVFLCLNAPYRPFPKSCGISGIVRAALSRANITHPPSHGAHLLRHSAATALLRSGATLETVSSVLRHRSLDMTAYYAKVDIPTLMQIAQPWPEDTPC